MKKTTEEKTEELARVISVKRTGTDAMWELYLSEAYDKVFNLNN